MHVAFYSFVDPSGTSGENHFARQLAVALGRHPKLEVSLICPRPGRPGAEAMEGSLRTYFLPEKQRGSFRWQAQIQPAMWRCTRVAVRERGPLSGIVTTLRIGTLVPPLWSALRKVPEVLVMESHAAREVPRRYPLPGAARAIEAVTFLNAVRAKRVFVAHGGVKPWITSMPGVRSNRVVTFHHVVDPAHFPNLDVMEARRELDVGVGSKGPVVGFVGSFKWYHRLDLLVRAAARSRHSDLRVLLVGDGPERSAIEDQAKRLGISSRCIFTGNVPHSLVGRYMAACDLLYGVIDAHHCGHPMKVYEYLAAGRPVVATASEELKFIEEWNVGALVKTVNEPAVYNSMKKILERDSVERRRTGQRIRQYIIENWTWDALADRIACAFLADDA